MRRGGRASSSRSSIRGPAVRLGVGIAIAAGITYAAMSWLKTEEAGQQAAQAHLADAKQRVATALEDRRDLAAYKSVTTPWSRIISLARKSACHGSSITPASLSWAILFHWC